MKLKEMGFLAGKVATDGVNSLAIGTLTDGRLLIVAKTPNGEGCTEYITAHEANIAFNAIINKTGMAVL